MHGLMPLASLAESPPQQLQYFFADEMYSGGRTGGAPWDRTGRGLRRGRREYGSAEGLEHSAQ